MVVPNAGHPGGGGGEQYHHPRQQYQQQPPPQQYRHGHGHGHPRPPHGGTGLANYSHHHQQQHEMVADNHGLNGGKNHYSSSGPIQEHANPSAPNNQDHRNDDVDDIHLQQHAYNGSGCAAGPAIPQYQGGELTRLASHIGKMLEPKPIIVHYKKKRPGQQQQQQQQHLGGDGAPAMPLGQTGEMAHAVPRGQRRVRNPPPRMTHLGPSRGGQQQDGREDGTEGGDNQGFSCYYSRRPGEYLPDNRSDWRPVELRDDETTPLPWDHRNRSNAGNHNHVGTDTPLHANTSANATAQRSEPRDGSVGGGNDNDNDQLPPMVLQTMFQYDDEEFIAAANTIMEHIQWREVAHMDRKIGKMMAESSSIAVRGGAGIKEGGEDGEGSTSNSTLSSSGTAPSLIDNLGKEFIEGFLSALEHRVERTTGTSSNFSRGGEENEMDGIVMEIKSMVDQHAAYFVAKEEIRVQMTMPNDKERTNIGTEITPEPESPTRKPAFLPHADQSIAGYVPLEHNTPRSKNTSAANKADEVSIAKSFASTVKSAYEKIEESLKKNIAREGSEANLQVKEEEPKAPPGGTKAGTKSSVAYGRYIEPSSSALLDQSQRRQELVSEMQRLHAFMEKAGPTHSEVQRSCQYRIEELRTELEAMTLAAVNDGEISEVSSRSFDEKEQGVGFAMISPSTARQQAEREKDLKRDELIEKLEKLEQQLAAASNRVVRASYERRIEKLQRELTELDGLEISPRSFEEADIVQQVEPSISKDTRKDSLQRQAVVDEMKRVEHVFNSTRVEGVKDSCRVRLEELRLELMSLTPDKGEGEDVTPSVDIAPSSSFSVQDGRKSVIHNAPTTGNTARKGKEQRHVKVMAPTNLPGGCQFSARLGSGEEFLATVPSGGVRKGEIFVSPVGGIEEMQLGSSACGCMSLMDYLYDKL